LENIIRAQERTPKIRAQVKYYQSNATSDMLAITPRQKTGQCENIGTANSKQKIIKYGQYLRVIRKAKYTRTQRTFFLAHFMH
jgi:hypothetical protein